MPTQNRRVATYLPPHIDEPFKAFKSQRDIKGDSEALIAILSEYLQVSQEVAYSSSSNLLQRIEAIEEKLGSLKSELLSEFQIKLQTPTQPEVSKQESELLGGLQGNLLISNSDLVCPKCNSINIGKSGHNAAGKQRHQCRDCKHRFVDK
jgi:InsA N-terminal domain